MKAIAPGLRRYMTRADFIAGALLLAAVAAYPFFPVLLWLSPVCFLAAFLHVRFYKLNGPERALLLACCAAAALLATAVNAFWGYTQTAPGDIWKDDLEYLTQSAAVTDSWKAGIFPELWRKGAPPYLGTLHTGYHRVVAACFYLFGKSVWAGVLPNILTVALLPMLLFFLYRELFGADDPHNGRNLILRPDFLAALATAVHPSLYYWQKWLLKDVLLAGVFIASLLMALAAVRRRSFWCTLGALLLFIFLFTLRAYAALALAVGLTAFFLTHLPSRISLWIALHLLLLIVLTAYTSTGGKLAAQLANSLGYLLPKQVQTVQGTLHLIGVGIPRLFLAPYAWVKAFGEHPTYGLYPGMWYLYLLIYPSAGAGLLHSIKANHRPTAVTIAVWAAGAWIFLTVYGGDAPRQRLFLEMLLIPYSALGIRKPQLRWVALIWFMLLFLFAAVQLLTLHTRY